MTAEIDNGWFDIAHVPSTCVRRYADAQIITVTLFSGGNSKRHLSHFRPEHGIALFCYSVGRRGSF